jgi:hypothetical protein
MIFVEDLKISHLLLFSGFDAVSTNAERLTFSV